MIIKAQEVTRKCGNNRNAKSEDVRRKRTEPINLTTQYPKM